MKAIHIIMRPRDKFVWFFSGDDVLAGKMSTLHGHKLAPAHQKDDPPSFQTRRHSPNIGEASDGGSERMAHRAVA
jgi:hypothetical protein